MTIERLFLAHDALQLVERNGQAAAFMINFFGKSEPEHIFFPLRKGLDVEKVFHADVFRDGISAQVPQPRVSEGVSLKL